MVSRHSVKHCWIRWEDEGLTKLPLCKVLSPASSCRAAQAALASRPSSEVVCSAAMPVLQVTSSACKEKLWIGEEELSSRLRTTQGRQGMSSRSCVQTVQVLQSVTTYFDRLMAGTSRWRYSTKALLSFRKL